LLAKAGGSAVKRTDGLKLLLIAVLLAVVLALLIAILALALGFGLRD
jgi:hypothetical protein